MSISASIDRAREFCFFESDFGFVCALFFFLFILIVQVLVDLSWLLRFTVLQHTRGAAVHVYYILSFPVHLQEIVTFVSKCVAAVQMLSVLISFDND